MEWLSNAGAGVGVGEEDMKKRWEEVGDQKRERKTVPLLRPTSEPLRKCARVYTCGHRIFRSIVYNCQFNKAFKLSAL